MVGLIIFLVAACLILMIVVVCSVVKRKRINYVLSNSAYLVALKEINDRYTFDSNINRNLEFHYTLNSKAKFDRIYAEGAIKQAFFDNRLKIKTSVEKVARYKVLYNKYLAEISKIKATDFNLLPKTKLLKQSKYYDIEKRLVSQTIKKPTLSLSMVVAWSYTSPAGRNHYEDKRTLDYNQIVKYYSNYYDVNLSKVEENDYLEQTIRNVINLMVNYGYSIAQIINLFKTFGVNADERLAMITAAKAGFTKNKRSNIYVKSSVGSVADLVLISADNNGLIHYENTVKDEEYDNAIKSLERERKIVPISNLLFLKLDNSLSYNGLTFEDIQHFDRLVREYSENHRYFSVKSIQDNIKCKVTECPYEGCFLYALLKHNGFLYEIPCIEKLFTAQVSKATRLKFLKYLIGKNKSVNAFDLIQAIKDTYGVEYTIYSIIYDIDKGKTKLYYNNETEKIYSDKEFFYEEII